MSKKDIVLLEQAYDRVYSKNTQNEAIDPLMLDPHNTDIGPHLGLAAAAAAWLWQSVKGYIDNPPEKQHAERLLREPKTVQAVSDFLNMPNVENKSALLKRLEGVPALAEKPNLLYKVLDHLRALDPDELRSKAKEYNS